MLAEPTVVIISQYVSVKTVMLYALNLHSDVCQLFLKKNLENKISYSHVPTCITELELWKRLQYSVKASSSLENLGHSTKFQLSSSIPTEWKM